MRIAAATSRRRRACWARDVRDGYAALIARCCLESANAEDASLRPVRHRGADHLGAHGHLHVGGARGCGVERRRPGRRGIAVPNHRRHQARHRHGEEADKPTVCDQPHSANVGHEAFRYTLEARPAVVSFALGDPGDLVRQAHDVGSLVMLQVTTVAQAVQAADRGVDVIIAQGGEAGGYCGEVSTVTLVPQVVDAVSPIPVAAAGGIFDGRGIAAALMLGAVGVNLGTRFIASTEAPAPDAWKQAITAAASEDAIKVDVLNDISPLPGTVGFQTVLRSLHTTFIDEWSAQREAARRDRDRLRDQIVSTTQAGRPHACLLTAGQTAGGIKQILSVGDIMRRLVAETEAALSRAPALAAALQSGRAA